MSPAPRPLTPRQHQLLGFLRIYYRENGYMPTGRAIMVRMNLRSTGSPIRLLRSLERKGHIKRFPKRARAIEFTVRDRVPA
jgi:repressor LexA